MRFRKRAKTTGGVTKRLFGDRTPFAEAAIATEERTALLDPEEVESPEMPAHEEPYMGADPTQRLLTALGRFQRQVAKAETGAAQEAWCDECVNQIITGIEIALSQGWDNVREALTDTARVLQSYEEPRRANECVSFLQDSYEILCLMVGDIIVDNTRSGVMRKWRERYEQAITDLTRAGLQVIEDEEEPAPAPANGNGHYAAPVPRAKAPVEEYDAVPFEQESAEEQEEDEFHNVYSEAELAALTEDIPLQTEEVREESSPFAFPEMTGAEDAGEADSDDESSAPEDAFAWAREPEERIEDLEKVPWPELHAQEEAGEETALAADQEAELTLREEDAESSAAEEMLVEEHSLEVLEEPPLGAPPLEEMPAGEHFDQEDLFTAQEAQVSASVPSAEMPTGELPEETEALEAVLPEELDPASAQTEPMPCAEAPPEEAEAALPEETPAAPADEVPQEFEDAPDQIQTLFRTVQNAITRGDVAHAKRLALQLAASMAQLEVDRAQEDLERAEIELRENEAATEAARAAVKQAEEDVAAVEERIAETQQEFQTRRQHIGELRERATAIEAAIEDIDAQILALQERRAAELQQRDGVEEQIEEALSEESRVQTDLDELSEAERQAHQQLEASRGDVETLRLEHAEHQQTIARVMALLESRRGSAGEIARTLQPEGEGEDNGAQSELEL